MLALAEAPPSYSLKERAIVGAAGIGFALARVAASDAPIFAAVCTLIVVYELTSRAVADGAAEGLSDSSQMRAMGVWMGIATRWVMAYLLDWMESRCRCVVVKQVVASADVQLGLLHGRHVDECQRMRTRLALATAELMPPAVSATSPVPVVDV